MAISDHNYNTARQLLMAAGSMTAAASHPKHTGGKGSPDGHGLSLLREARDEFNGFAEPHRSNGRRAVVAAAAQMNIAKW
jgi:hypothetical protein